MSKKKDKDHYNRYGWTVDETNLATLPKAAPQAAKDLVKWLTLEGRRKSLTEWLNCVGDDSKIHGKYWPIGAWTHRMSHSNPNQANIASPFAGTPQTPVEEIKARYDGAMRNLWKASDGAWLVGTDAEGIQLRLLAHYMKSQEYVDAICKGKKEDETDIHNMNKKALGPICRTRDDAKTFIYAFLLGASIPKVAEILNCSTKEASQAVNNFLIALPGLKRLKEWTIPNDARRGYFIGLDGRKVNCNSEHHMLAGYLQNGEAVIMKHWIIEWRSRAKAAGIKFRQVNFVHDEVQVEVFSLEDAEKLLDIQKESMLKINDDLKLFCPMAVDGRVGKTWLESH